MWYVLPVEFSIALTTKVASMSTLERMQRSPSNTRVRGLRAKTLNLNPVMSENSLMILTMASSIPHLPILSRTASARSEA